ncbi:hypothetical protein [Paractinoplanes toevensis]|uniref:Uncharacterized protein n=1 Tax=Paractinoplanes toevensis TaxID=571911 RepID=A0A919TB24_9ACTN|nr:hypothetical protein [Actinoplanes toevensis]GIM91165.1 hypothetical protein Ato02nite_029580 [Actinoplanes toevensis]
MRTREAVEAARWLAAHGVTRQSRGRWLDDGRELDDNELAHEWTRDLLVDGGLRLGLGLLDLLDQYWVTVEIGWYAAERDDPGVYDAMWAGYRERLENAAPCEAVLYSLWVDWFENRDTVDAAFGAVLADDVRHLRSRRRLRELAAGRTHRRAWRVLANSGPVRWSLKHDIYETATALPELHQAVFRGLLMSYHDIYGDLSPVAALTLLDALHLPPDTEHLTALRAVLATGAHNHYRNPGLWEQMVG